MKKPMWGFKKTDNELQRAILLTTVETKVLLKHLRDLRRALKMSNNLGKLWGFEPYQLDYMNTGIKENLQRIVAAADEGRQWMEHFVKLNRGKD